MPNFKTGFYTGPVITSTSNCFDQTESYFCGTDTPLQSIQGSYLSGVPPKGKSVCHVSFLSNILLRIPIPVSVLKMFLQAFSIA